MKNKKITIILTVVLILIVASICCIKPIKQYLIRKDNTCWLAYGLKQRLDSKELNYKQETTFNIKTVNKDFTTQQLLNNIFQDIVIKSESNYDMNNFKRLTDTKIILKNQELMNMKMLANKDSVIYRIPLLFNKDVYLDYKELYMPNSSTKINLLNYMPLMDLKQSTYYENLSKDILKLISKNLNNKFKEQNNIEIKTIVDGTEKNITCDELKLTLNTEDIKKLLEEVSLFGKNNNNAKLFIKDKIYQFLNIVEKNNDFKFFNLKKEEIDKFRSNKEFDENYNKIFDEIINSVNNIKVDDSLKIELSFRFDKDNFIRNIIGRYSFRLDHSLILNINQTCNIDNKVNKEVLNKNGLNKDVNLKDINPLEINNRVEQYMQQLMGAYLSISQ